MKNADASAGYPWVIDCHSDFPSVLLKRAFDGSSGELGNVWLPEFKAGGVGVVFAAIWIDSVYVPESSLRRAVQTTDALLEQVAENQANVLLALSVEDIETAIKTQRTALILAFEGAEPFGHDLAAMRLFHRLGLRVLGLTWMRRTAFGDGTWENDSGGGLTRLGREAVAEANRLRILLDVSHGSDKTVMDVLDCSAAPVIASHSNARSVTQHPRNLTDEQIRRLAEAGGVVAVTSAPAFVDSAHPSIDRMVDHVAHIAQLVGAEHVGLGLDFTKEVYASGAAQGIAAWSPAGRHIPAHLENLSRPSEMPRLMTALETRGFGQDEISAIAHGNVLRVLSRAI